MDFRIGIEDTSDLGGGGPDAPEIDDDSGADDSLAGFTKASRGSSFPCSCLTSAIALSNDCTCCPCGCPCGCPCPCGITKGGNLTRSVKFLPLATEGVAAVGIGANGSYKSEGFLGFLARAASHGFLNWGA